MILRHEREPRESYGTDPSGVAGRESRRGTKRPMRKETGIGRGCRRRARDTAVQQALREGC
jgi:hypothetical protein